MIFDYVSSVLENGKSDFESHHDVYESVGEILLNVSNGEKTEQDVLQICQQILDAYERYFVSLSTTCFL